MSELKDKLMELIRNNEPLAIEDKWVKLVDVDFRNEVIQITFVEEDEQE